LDRSWQQNKSWLTPCFTQKKKTLESDGYLCSHITSACCLPNNRPGDKIYLICHDHYLTFCWWLNPMNPFILNQQCCFVPYKNLHQVRKRTFVSCPSFIAEPLKDVNVLYLIVRLYTWMLSAVILNTIFHYITNCV
jgi:hypothetical protein